MSVVGVCCLYGFDVFVSCCSDGVLIGVVVVLLGIGLLLSLGVLWSKMGVQKP